VFDTVMRKTWGWQKKEDWIAGVQIAKATGIKKSNVSRGLSKLIKHRLVIKTDNKLKINKDYSEWLPFGVIRSDNKLKVIRSDNKVIKRELGVIKSDNKKLSKERDTKEKKETIQKKGSEEFEYFIKKFNELFNRKFRETAGMLKKYKKRRETFKEKEIIYALGQLSASSWHQGENSRGWRANPGFLLRNDEQVDKWLNTTSKEVEEYKNIKFIGEE